MSTGAEDLGDGNAWKKMTAGATTGDEHMDGLGVGFGLHEKERGWVA